MAAKETKKKKQSQKNRQASGTGTRTVAQLTEAGLQTREEYGKAKNTKTNYRGYLERGDRVLAGIVRGREEAEAAGTVFTDGIKTSELAKAFETQPNKWSSKALELVLIQKCIDEGLGKSTMDGFHAAYVARWDDMYVNIQFKQS